MNKLKKIERTLIHKFDLEQAHEDISTEEMLKSWLATEIEYLIERDFSALMQLLYRIDINEKLLKSKLQNNTLADSGVVIAELIIQREKQKLEWREKFKNSNPFSDSEDEVEKW